MHIRHAIFNPEHCTTRKIAHYMSDLWRIYDPCFKGQWWFSTLKPCNDCQKTNKTNTSFCQFFQINVHFLNFKEYRLCAIIGVLLRTGVHKSSCGSIVGSAVYR